MAYKRGRKWIASGYDSATRSKRQLGTFATKKEATTTEADWRIKQHPTGRETCGAFAERWPTDYPRPRAGTTITNVARLKAFIGEFKHVRLAAIDRPTARAWALKHPSSLPAVRAMYGDALRDGLVDHNPFANLRLPGSRGRADIVALTEPQLTALADLALDARMELHDYAPQLRAMVLFAGYVGLRPGELFALRRGDLAGELCTITRALDSKSGQIQLPKNGRTRVVTVPPPAQLALRDVPVYPSGLLFVTPRGAMWTRTAHHYYWKSLRMLAGHPGLDHYELRHAAATMLLERGATPWDVAIQLGHTDGGRLVQTIYGHPQEAGARSRLLGAWDADVKPLRAVNEATG